MRVLVLGGAGFIGSHTCVELLLGGHEIAVFDNLSNGFQMALERVKIITDKTFTFFKGNICSFSDLDKAFEAFEPEAVIHFAGLKAVKNSVVEPLKYYAVNVSGTIALLEVMDKWNCTKIVFSSSATVYGVPNYLPYDEVHDINPTTPYGKTKSIVEGILKDWVSSKSIEISATALRYFNPIGAHKSGMIGESPHGTPDNLMPFISQVAVGQRPKLNIFGNDYDTRDGTCERDYLHVSDLAKAHVTTLENQKKLSAFETLNLGSGISTSVLELVTEFEDVSGKKIKRKFLDRRLGDLPAFWADASLANKKLGITFNSTIKEMCQDSWRWQVNNPTGYQI